ncbi:MAG: hypothetical protein JXA87_10975 [Thermoleophilia bacterium]|nr:hypothetical protein [Thermoleophilia bacterium]
MTLKTRWTTPELIVLARGKPEEAVLATCKGGSYGGARANVVACSQNNGNCQGQCALIMPS